MAPPLRPLSGCCCWGRVTALGVGARHRSTCLGLCPSPSHQSANPPPPAAQVQFLKEWVALLRKTPPHLRAAARRGSYFWRKPPPAPGGAEALSCACGGTCVGVKVWVWCLGTGVGGRGGASLPAVSRRARSAAPARLKLGALLPLGTRRPPPPAGVPRKKGLPKLLQRLAVGITGGRCVGGQGGRAGRRAGGEGRADGLRYVGARPGRATEHAESGCTFFLCPPPAPPHPTPPHSQPTHPPQLPPCAWCTLWFHPPPLATAVARRRPAVPRLTPLPGSACRRSPPHSGALAPHALGGCSPFF